MQNNFLLRRAPAWARALNRLVLLIFAAANCAPADLGYVVLRKQ